MAMSAAKKKIMAMTANTRTITVEIMVSRREGHVTLAVSPRTCWRKVKGLVVFEAIYRSVFKTRRPGLLNDPAGRDVPPGLDVTPNQRNHFAHANRTRKAGFPAPRVACLFRLHKTDS